MERRFEAVLKAMKENGIRDPFHLIGGLLAMLQDQHSHTKGFNYEGTLHDGLDGTTGRHATTLPESLANYSRVIGAMALHNAENGRKHGQLNMDALEYHGRTLKALADLLEYYLPSWNAAGSELEESVRRLHRQLERQKGNPEADPDENKPDADPPTPPKRF
jgi:hypothetical protein